MSFIADKQTLDDLQLLGKFNNSSVFSLFNQVRSRGGEKLLDALFLHPLKDPEQINQRSSAFRWMQEHPIPFPFDEQLLGKMEAYLDEAGSSSILLSFWHIGRKKATAVLLKDEAYGLQLEGINTCVDGLQGCARLLQQLENKGWDKNSPWEKWAVLTRSVFQNKQLSHLLKETSSATRSFLQIASLHHLFSGVLQDKLRNMLQHLYELDMLTAVAGVAREKKFAYATAWPASANKFEARGIRHPRLEKAVANDLSFQGSSNVLFLTGANMAGKSTIMKSTGILLYLAHMGFPVAAESLDFSVLDGLYSSVNVPDDLSQGYSHFYAEVLRVKKVAQEVDSGKNLFVIFDELFKGTNVKDAFDATLAVTVAFAQFPNCFYIISTHIIEVGEELKKVGDNIQFGFMPTVMEGHLPRYTYRMQPGITEDRQGMIIIENEGILEML
ncbi:MAG: DNA mismatch repair protein [Candidatus Pseudobacter hemicellulosilyticus]|uniref:DNA mismatch repair protein n=1 Tax=Candidatus Pseudobacter hemicellulosilyticus TaxID=3121375 RepID=A0AAJ5WVE6_9BACT|nr:MAG: DNA mismatch repair protein [Pseudobacter sp.]